MIERFHLRVPVILAPMAGDASTPELAAAVSEAGGLGSLGLAYNSPQQIRDAVAATRRLSVGPFAVNLFSPLAAQPLTGDAAAVTDFISQLHGEFGLPPASIPERPAEDFEAQLAAVLECEVPVFSFTFGLMPPAAMAQLRDRGIYTIGTATTVREAMLLEASGVDAIVAQGSEAGGHRGTFAEPAESSLIGSMALIPQVVDAVKVPVIASGGIMDGRGIAAALALGAVAVQMGTAFLTARESGAVPAYKRRVLDAAESDLILTRSFSGRWARGLSNRFIREFESRFAEPLSYPWQNALTRGLRRAAAQREDAEYLSLWAGQGTRMTREESAGDLVRRLAEELAQTRQRLARS